MTDTEQEIDAWHQRYQRIMAFSEIQIDDPPELTLRDVVDLAFDEHDAVAQLQAYYRGYPAGVTTLSFRIDCARISQQAWTVRVSASKVPLQCYDLVYIALVTDKPSTKRLVRSVAECIRQYYRHAWVISDNRAYCYISLPVVSPQD